MTTIFLLLAVLSAWCSYNLYRPIYREKHGAAVSFITGWLVGELALHHIIFQAVVTLLFVAAGTVTGVMGAFALLMLFVSWSAMACFYLRSSVADDAVEKALREGLGQDYRDQILPELSENFKDDIEHKRLYRPFASIASQDVECIKNIVYHKVDGMNLKLDIRRHESKLENCPVLFQIHGGAWTYRLGSKNEQALPLMNHLAARGWVCVSIDYRLSPRATFPDHIIDCKRALAWVKENIADYGGNPDFIIATGGSAGGHLSSLLALTANNPQFQPGFEEVDIAVQGCIPFYGIYDFYDEDRLQYNKGLEDILRTSVLKVSKQDNPDLYYQASPIHQITKDAPSFFVIQGDRDTLVSDKEARRFAGELRAQSDEGIVYAEIPGAQHAFDIFPSLRSELVMYGVERYAAWLYSAYLRK